jgi:hypothetical protein
MLLWDQSPGDKEVVVAYDGDSLHTFLLDLDNVAGASVPALGKCRQKSFQCCGSGSGIRCFFDPWIRDEHRGLYFREFRNNFLG